MQNTRCFNRVKLIRSRIEVPNQINNTVKGIFEIRDEIYIRTGHIT